MVIFRLLVGLIIIFLLVAFSIRNMTPVSLDFYFYKTPEIPVFVIIFLSLIIGVAVAWILVIGEQLKLRAEIRRKNKKIKELESQLEVYETQRIAQREEKTEEGGEAKDEGASEGLQSQGG